MKVVRQLIPVLVHVLLVCGTHMELSFVYLFFKYEGYLAHLQLLYSSYA